MTARKWLTAWCTGLVHRSGGSGALDGTGGGGWPLVAAAATMRTSPRSLISAELRFAGVDGVATGALRSVSLTTTVSPDSGNVS